MALQAGEVNKTVTVDAQGFVLTGYTCTLVTLDPQNVRHTLALTINSNTTSASYSTQAADFPESGIYKMQLKLTKMDGTLLLSPVVNKLIGPAL